MNLKTVWEHKNVQDMYGAVQELVCAFVINQQEIERARKNKKSMLKVYQERDNDLEKAFKNCLTECQCILDRYK